MIHTKTPNTRVALRKKRWLVPSAMLGVIVLAAAAGLLWFFSGEAPAEVDLAATASSVAESAGATEAATAVQAAADDDAAETGSTGIEGTWMVDTSVGQFTVEDTTTATFVGFRVEEVLNSIGSTTAVGRTPDVAGSVTIEGTTLTAAEVTADLTSIVSDESRREDPIQRALNTSSNPAATFVLTEPVELGEDAAAGNVVSVVASGELTINGVPDQVDVELEAQLVDGMILVTGTTEIVFADYDVTTPTSPAVLSVEDNGIVEIQLWLSQ